MQLFKKNLMLLSDKNKKKQIIKYFGKGYVSTIEQLGIMGKLWAEISEAKSGG